MEDKYRDLIHFLGCNSCNIIEENIYDDFKHKNCRLLLQKKKCLPILIIIDYYWDVEDIYLFADFNKVFDKCGKCPIRLKINKNFKFDDILCCFDLMQEAGIEWSSNFGIIEKTGQGYKALDLKGVDVLRKKDKQKFKRKDK